jgi:hypothetical protein
MSFTRAKAAEIGNKLGCDANVVLAVAEVESGGGHDLPDGRPKILFEAHWFSKLTGHKYDETYPMISSREWNRSLYQGGAAEYNRLNAAISLDADAAMQSASWGLFQIMGFNYKACGFSHVMDFVNFIKGPDDADMEAFCSFVKANPPILKAMQTKDWKAFALHYNGPGAVASYSAKMADAYAMFVGRPDRAEEGPPIPVADPTLKPQNPISSKTVVTAGAATVGTASIIVENAKPAIDAIQNTATTIQQAGTAWQGMKDALGAFGNGHVFTVAVLLLVVCALAFIAWRRFRQGAAVAP